VAFGRKEKNYASKLKTEGVSVQRKINMQTQNTMMVSVG